MVTLLFLILALTGSLKVHLEINEILGFASMFAFCDAITALIAECLAERIWRKEKA